MLTNNRSLELMADSEAVAERWVEVLESIANQVRGARARAMCMLSRAGTRARIPNEQVGGAQVEGSPSQPHPTLLTLPNEQVPKSMKAPDAPPDEWNEELDDEADAEEAPPPPVRRNTSGQILLRVRALYDYEAVEADELTLHAGVESLGLELKP